MHVCNPFDRCANVPIYCRRKLHIFRFRCSQHNIQFCPLRESRFCSSVLDFYKNVRGSFHVHFFGNPAKSRKHASYQCKHVRLRKRIFTKCIRIHMKSIASMRIAKLHQSSEYLRILIVRWCGSCDVHRGDAQTTTLLARRADLLRGC